VLKKESKAAMNYRSSKLIVYVKLNKNILITTHTEQIQYS